MVNFMIWNRTYAAGLELVGESGWLGPWESRLGCDFLRAPSRLLVDLKESRRVVSHEI